MKLYKAKSFAIYCDHDNYKIYEKLEHVDDPDQEPILELCHDWFEAFTGVVLDSVGDVAVITLDVKAAMERSYKMVKVK